MAQAQAREPHWQVQEAKQRFSELLRRAREDGPQIVTRHGEDVAVVIDIEEYRRLARPRPDFKKFLVTASELAELEIERSEDSGRMVDFG